MRRWFASAFTLAICSAASAGQSLTNQDALTLLNRIVQATHQLSFSGVYVYQHGSDVQSSRITHVFDGGNSFEKLEALDGPPQEFIRLNNTLTSYAPAKYGSVADVPATVRFFPTVLPENIRGLMEHYYAIKQEVDRVADLDCQMLLLTPRDGLRNPYRFCYDPSTGLVLKSQSFNEKRELNEQIAFTQVVIGGVIDRSVFKPRWANKVGSWQRNDGPVKADDLDVDSRLLPAGYRLVRGGKRQLPGKPRPVSQYLFSDGLASVSVFLENQGTPSKVPQGLSRQGETNLYSESDGNWVLMVLGDVPAAALQQFGQALSVRPKSGN